MSLIFSELFSVNNIARICLLCGPPSSVLLRLKSCQISYVHEFDVISFKHEERDKRKRLKENIIKKRK